MKKLAEDRQTRLFNAFKKRVLENKGKKIDNAKLYAGSPMYYYCEGCGVLVDTKPESWFLDPPPKHCEDCDMLKKEAFLDEFIDSDPKIKAIVAKYKR